MIDLVDACFDSIGYEYCRIARFWIAKNYNKILWKEGELTKWTSLRETIGVKCYLYLQVSYALACLMGLSSCIWLVVETTMAENVSALDPNADPPSSENAEFYLLASLMGGSAAMVVILSLTSAADLIDLSNGILLSSMLKVQCSMFNVCSI